MGREDLVRELLAMWNSGEREAIADRMHPEAEIRTLRSQLEDRTYRGPAGFRQVISDFDEDWAYVRFEPLAVHVRDELLVIVARMRSRGRASGIELEQTFGWLWRFRGDLVDRIDTFSDPDDALRAAGIDP